MKKLEISVIMPAYNHEKFVEEAIESVLSQTFKEFEFIIVNDGSTDNTEGIINTYKDSRILYCSQENQGACHAHNRGIELSKGEYIAFINSDDVYRPERLETLLDIAKKEDLSFVVTDIELIDQNSNIIQDPDHWWINWYEYLKTIYRTTDSPEKALLAGNYTISTSNFFFRSDIVKTIGLFRPFKYIIDYDFAFRAALHASKRFRFLQGKKLLSYRLHGENTILENPLMANYETFFFLTNAIETMYGQDLSLAFEHLNKIKRNVARSLGERYKKSTNQLGNGYEVLDHKYKELSRKYQGIAFSQLPNILDYNKKLLEEIYIFKNSYSFKTGRAITFPVRILANKILRQNSIRPISVTANSVEELHSRLDGIIMDIALVSFDLFDTIFEREIDPPDKVKEIVARRISDYLLETYSIRYSPKELLKLRDTVEISLRNQSLSAGKDFECCYSEIVREMILRILGRDDERLASAIIQQEIEVENEVLYIKKGMFEILEWLKNKGKKIVAISDMYLDCEYIKEIIHNKSLDHLIDDVYVSSDLAICKYSGNLFKHVMLEECILPSRMLHIGDNKTSDHHVPLELGINTVFLKDKEHLKKKYILKTYNKLAVHNPYWRGRHLLQLIRPPDMTEGFFYPFGFSFLGPVYVTFVYGVIEILKKYNIKTVYFIARDGELFLHIFQRLAPHFFKDRELPITRYVYLTRKSTALASLYKGFPLEKAIIPLYNPKQQGLYSICNVYGLPPHELIKKAREYGFQDIKSPINNWYDKQFKSFILDRQVQEMVMEYAQKDRELLEEYLTQIGFFNNGSVAFVDVGWNATIQKFIQDAFIGRKDYPHIYGIYLGFRNGMKHQFDESKNTIIGMLYDDRLNKPTEKIMNRFEEIFEEGARAFHPTTIGYRKNIKTGVLEPIFKEETSPDRISEVSFDEKINKLRRGVLDFSQEFIRALGLTNYSFEDIKPFVQSMIERLVAYPNTEEVRNLMKLKHAEDFGNENVMDFSNEKINGLKEILNPGKFLKKIKFSNWSYGTAKSSGIPGINFLLRFYDLMVGH